jgi:hypothetical protein
MAAATGSGNWLLRDLRKTATWSILTVNPAIDKSPLSIEDIHFDLNAATLRLMLTFNQLQQLLAFFFHYPGIFVKSFMIIAEQM